MLGEQEIEVRDRDGRVELLSFTGELVAAGPVEAEVYRLDDRGVLAIYAEERGWDRFASPEEFAEWAAGEGRNNLGRDTEEAIEAALLEFGVPRRVEL